MARAFAANGHVVTLFGTFACMPSDRATYEERYKRRADVSDEDGVLYYCDADTYAQRLTDVCSGDEEPIDLLVASRYVALLPSSSSSEVAASKTTIKHVWLWCHDTAPIGGGNPIAR